VSRRWKNRQCRSVHSIIGAMENFVSNILLLLDFSMFDPSDHCCRDRRAGAAIVMFILHSFQWLGMCSSYFLRSPAHRAVLRCRTAEEDAGQGTDRL
jgi:hypothetical protein